MSLGSGVGVLWFCAEIYRDIGVRALRDSGGGVLRDSGVGVLEDSGVGVLWGIGDAMRFIQ